MKSPRSSHPCPGRLLHAGSTKHPQEGSQASASFSLPPSLLATPERPLGFCMTCLCIDGGVRGDWLHPVLTKEVRCVLLLYSFIPQALSQPCCVSALDLSDLYHEQEESAVPGSKMGQMCKSLCLHYFICCDAISLVSSPQQQKKTSCHLRL